MRLDLLKNFRIHRRPDAVAVDAIAARRWLGHLAQLPHVLHRNHDLDIHVGRSTSIDDLNVAPRCSAVDDMTPAEEAGDLFERSLRCRQANALHWSPNEMLKALEGHRHVCATFGSSDRMNLIDNYCIDIAQGLLGRRRQHQIERLGRCD